MTDTARLPLAPATGTSFVAQTTGKPDAVTLEDVTGIVQAAFGGIPVIVHKETPEGENARPVYVIAPVSHHKGNEVGAIKRLGFELTDVESVKNKTGFLEKLTVNPDAIVEMLVTERHVENEAEGHEKLGNTSFLTSAIRNSYDTETQKMSPRKGFEAATAVKTKSGKVLIDHVSADADQLLSLGLSGSDVTKEPIAMHAIEVDAERLEAVVKHQLSTKAGTEGFLSGSRSRGGSARRGG